MLTSTAIVMQLLEERGLEARIRANGRARMQAEIERGMAAGAAFFSGNGKRLGVETAGPAA